MLQLRKPIVTLLFTDLVNSTALLQRAGDEQAQRVFRVHHKLLKEAVAANGGHTVKWLGDGLMVAFPSAPSNLLVYLAHPASFWFPDDRMTQ